MNPKAPFDFAKLPLGTVVSHVNTRSVSRYRKVEGGTGWVCCDLDGYPKYGDKPQAQLEGTFAVDIEVHELGPVKPGKKAARIAELEEALANSQDAHANAAGALQNAIRRADDYLKRAQDAELNLRRAKEAIVDQQTALAAERVRVEQLQAQVNNQAAKFAAVRRALGEA